jgi:hypothetical protein
LKALERVPYSMGAPTVIVEFLAGTALTGGIAVMEGVPIHGRRESRVDGRGGSGREVRER